MLREMSEQNSYTLIQFFKCLANEDRLKIVGLLAAQERNVEELSDLLDIKAHRVTHHLAKLKELDLVQLRIEGNTQLYRLNSEALEQLNKESFTLVKSMDEPAQEYANYEDWERKVLKAYLDKEQIIAIPAQRKKRDVILNWLVNKFDKGVRYPERVVNEIIKRHHPDIATLRREFIMTRLMKREDAGGAYWRV